MENKGIPPEDWLEMTEDMHEMLLQSRLEEIKAETEEWKAMAELLKNDPDASREDIKTYESAVKANMWLIERIERASDDFDEEISDLEE